MTCAELEAYLPELADDTLDPATRAQLELDKHLADCPDCRAQLTQAILARRVALRLRTQTVRLPADFEARVLARIQTQNFGVDLVNFSCQGFVAWLVELIDLVFDLILGGRDPQPQPAL